MAEQAVAAPDRGVWGKSIGRLPPADWFPAPPDFVGIGTQKAGTTWWHRTIESHPQVFSRHWQKERLYFSRFGHVDFTDADVAAYAELFYRPPGGRAGEWSPSYMCDFWVPPLLARAAPDTRLLVLLRNPVARYRSGVRHSMHVEKMALKVAQRDAHHRGYYFAQLAPYLRLFGRERILLLQYEQCVAQPVAQIRRTFEHLELEPVGFRPPNLDVMYNESRGAPFTVPDHTSRELVELYRDDVASLAAAFPDLDLDLWPEFR